MVRYGLKSGATWPGWIVTGWCSLCHADRAPAEGEFAERVAALFTPGAIEANVSP
jgi:hypothetical protein